MAAQPQAMFLVDASDRLAQSLELQHTADDLAEISVPELGEACLVYVLADGHAAGRLVAAKHADPTRAELLVALAKSACSESPWRQLVLGTAARGQPVILSQLNTTALLGDGRPPHVLLADLGIRTALFMPVIYGDQMRAIAIFLSDRTRHFTPARVRLAQELLERFAVALQAAQLAEACTTTLNTIQETLATTVHDLMSPLTCIKGTAQRLGRLEASVADPVASAEYTAHLKAIDTAANRMASALSTLLDTFRSAPPAARLGHPRVDLVAVARSVVASEQVRARQHAIHLREAVATLNGTWDAEHLERVLGHLIDNAVKYSQTGSRVEISLAAEVDNEGRWAVVRVADQGVGIPTPDLPFVFEPLRRGSNSGAVSGSGLGLASVWRIVKSYNGRVWIDSQEARGTSVTVRLPLAD